VKVRTRRHGGKSRPVANRRKNPLRVDPTRTQTLRRKFLARIRKQFGLLKGRLIKLVVDEDAFGIKLRQQGISANVRFAFRTDPEKITAFQDWLRTQFGQLLTGKNEEDLWQAFTEDGYRRGAGRAFDDTKSSAYVRANATDRMDHYEGTRDEFLRSSFARPVAVEKVKLLAGRAFDDLENVTADMATRMSRTLTDGLVTGSSPRDIAKDLSDDLDLSRGRAETIARSEIIRAHAEGQLDAMETLGVTQVGVQAEWLVTDDEKLCDECAPLEGIVLDIDEARGMLPRHPNCRCAWMPANVGEDDEDQKRSAREIEAAVRDSQEAGDDDFDVEVSTVRPTRNMGTQFLPEILAGNLPPSLIEFSRLLDNARSFFADCERDERGHCLPSGAGGTERVSPKELKAARDLAIAKAANAPVPTKEDVAKAQAGLAKLGANKYRRNIVGNTTDRAKRRQHLYDEFGDGKTCPCIYCGVKVGEGTLEQDKIYTTADGGKYNTKNVIPSCSECNKKRGDVPFREIQWGKVK
jgi:SPP1 gp7 family putative phage head morphogenesis protein